jgi:glutathione S-transferase
MITLYGSTGSPFVRKVLFVLAVKELPFEHIQQLPFTGDPEYLKINPLGKIPSLRDGELLLGDSTVICEYLEDAYPQPPVYPAEVNDKARARWLEELAGSRLSEYAAGIFFQRFMRPFAFKQEPDEALIEKIITRQLPPLLDYLESQVPAQGFLFGDITLADLSLLSPFVNAGYAGYEIDPARWPRFAGFLERVKADPVVAGLLADSAASLGVA